MDSLFARLSREPLETPREAVAEGQRRRLLAAMAKLAASDGYHDTAILEVTKTARVAPATFYEHFSTKQDCFLAVFDEAIDEAAARMQRAAGRESSWPDRMCAGLEAFVSFIVEVPEVARLCLVEIRATGPAGISRFEHAIERFIPALREGRELEPATRDLPEVLEHTILTGIAWVLYQRLVVDDVAAIPTLLPEMSEIMLAPYLGEEQAGRVAEGIGSARA